MIVLVILLVVTNLATLAVLCRLLLRTLDHPGPGREVSAVLDSAPPPPELSTSATRQIITIEILNPIELAGARGRWAGLAGMLVPGITKRVVHDQAIKIVKRTLVEENVIADVRLHAVRPGRLSGDPLHPDTPTPKAGTSGPAPASDDHRPGTHR